MKAWLVDQPGPVPSLYLGNAPLPEPGAGEVRVHVHAVGLNPVDLKLIVGGHPAWRYPQTPGVDVAGTVEACGPDATDWHVGERVIFLADMARGGAFADFIVAPADLLARIPVHLGFDVAAALPCAGITAYHALHRRLRVHQGQTVFVWGASGGVGGFAVQLARIAGLRVIAAYSGHDRDYVLGLGAHEAIDRTNDDVKEIVMALTDGRGVDAIVNPVGSERATLDLELLAHGGGLACMAGLPDLGRVRPFARAPSIHEVALGPAHDWVAARRDLAAIGQELAKLVANGNIKPLVSEIVGFDTLPQALAQLQGGAIRGKVVAHLRN